MKKNMLVGQSGGPTAVINASLYGAVSTALNCKESITSVYGMINGIEGFLEGRMMDMASLPFSGELELMKTTPASYLGSCRYRLPENLESAIYDRLFQKFDACDIGYVLYIGGNDSMDTVSKLSRWGAKRGSEIRFIGIPKTIDNDLIQTDHTPGFGSSAKYIASTVREIVLDAAVYDHRKSVTIVEIMGRDTGWLTASSALARKFNEDNPLLIYLPEQVFDQEAFLQDVQSKLESTANLVICISEGLQDQEGRFICELGHSVGKDNFGHKMLAGAGRYLEKLIKEELGIKTRSVELNVNQRCAAKLLSQVDHQEAIAAGRYGVESVLSGETGKMVAFRRKRDWPYEIEYTLADVDSICNQVKTFPKEWIIMRGTDVSEAFISYAKPLIEGEVKIPMSGGLPVFTYRR